MTSSLSAKNMKMATSGSEEKLHFELKVTKKMSLEWGCSGERQSEVNELTVLIFPIKLQQHKDLKFTHMIVLGMTLF